LARQVGLSPDDLALFASGGIATAKPIAWSRTRSAVYAMPLGLGLNFSSTAWIA
jgi:hypothetical protein